MSKKLIDVAEIIDSLHATPEYTNGGYPMVRVVDVNNSFLHLDNCFKVDKKTCDKHNKNHIPKKGDIIITRVGSYGMIALIDTDEELCLGQNIAIISPKGNDKFLYYYLQSPYMQNIIYGKSGGSSYKCIGLEDIRNFPFNADGIDCKKVGEFLYTIDSKIETNNKINAELEAMAKTIYDYWFLQFEFPNEEGKPYKSSGGKMVWNDELKREIPEGWKVSSLKNKYVVERGISYTSNDIESGKGIPMINLACIDINRNYRDGQLKYYNGNVKKNALLNGGDLVIACTDLTRNADIIGCPILTPNNGETYTYSMDIAKIVSDEKTFNKFFMYMMLRTDFYHSYIKKWASGTNVLHLNLDGINWYTTWIPSMDIQNKFAKTIEDIHKKKNKLLKENQELESLRDFLLPMLMNGQVGFKS